VIGRELAADSDDKISRTHARVYWTGETFEVTDAGSRNGTFVDGWSTKEGVALRGLYTVLRTGRTVSVLVRDVRPFENITLERSGSLVVGGSLGPVLRALDEAAIAEDNVAFVGTTSIGRELARRYAERLESSVMHIDLELTPIPLVKHVEKKLPARVMVIDVKRPFTIPDFAELHAWLQTDVRIVCVARDPDVFNFVEKDTRARLLPHVIRIPEYRFDETPTMIHDVVGQRIHATVIEASLLHLQSIAEDTFFRRLRDCLARAIDNGRTELRGDDLNNFIANETAMVQCIHGDLTRRQR
jgi:hypothetical protein